MNKQPEKWFRVAIISGVQRLLSLSLDGTPSSKTLPLTTETWIDVLWPTRLWCAELDETRISEAFRRLMIRCERWPAPKQLLLVLPPRPEQIKLVPPSRGRDAAMRAIKQAKEILGS